MSKSAPKKLVRRHVGPQPKTPVSIETQQKIKHIFLLLVITLLVAIPFIMGKYCEFNYPDAFDSGAYVYSAKHILDGAQIGVDEKPSAKVGTLLINMLGVRLFGFNETGPILIQTLLQAGALFLMFFTLLQLYGVLPAAVGVIIASTYLSAPVIAKYGNVKEQYMIAFMILGMSSFVIGQFRNKWIYILLAGAFISWGPLFKETGLSAVGALGLFVIAQPLLKHVSWKKTGNDILLLLAGAMIFIAPVCLWLAAEKAPMNNYPYAAFWKPFVRMATGSGDNIVQSVDTEVDVEQSAVEDSSEDMGFLMKILPGYVRDSWRIMDAQQRKDARSRVFRWYKVLILPIILALGSIIVRIFRIILNSRSKVKSGPQVGNDRFVLLFATWWIFDMAFVWVSPRSYEQYYLPLNASAAMLSGYFIAACRDKIQSSLDKPQRILVGSIGFILMIILSLHIFLGVGKSAHSGTVYTDSQGNPEKRNGYVQRLSDASGHRKGARGSWEVVGEYIKNNSTPDDGIYVWGWFPGIYVTAQRLSPAPKAFEGTMHTLSPEVLSERVEEILNAFKQKPPKFIVDSRKQHFPWDRPPLELWPSLSNGYRLFAGLSDSESNRLWSAFLDIFKPVDMNKADFLRADVPSLIKRYEDEYAKLLAKQVGPDEALRFKAMESFRRYVMENYTIVEPDQYRVLSGGRLYHRYFSDLVVFQRKRTALN